MDDNVVEMRKNLSVPVAAPAPAPLSTDEVSANLLKILGQSLELQKAQAGIIGAIADEVTTMRAELSGLGVAGAGIVIMLAGLGNRLVEMEKRIPTQAEG